MLTRDAAAQIMSSEIFVSLVPADGLHRDGLDEIAFAREMGKPVLFWRSPGRESVTIPKREGDIVVDGDEKACMAAIAQAVALQPHQGIKFLGDGHG